MSLTNLEVFNDFMYTSVHENIAQQMNLFNAASGNTIRMSWGNDNLGDYDYRVMYQILDGVVNRSITATGTQTPINLQHIEDISVKVAQGWTTTNIPPSIFSWIQRPPTEPMMVLSSLLSEHMLLHFLNDSLNCVEAAIDGQSAVNYTVPSNGNLSLVAMNAGQALFGDRFGAIKAWVMHSKPYFDLVAANLANTARLFTFGTVQIATDWFGRPIIITDAPPLVNSGSPNTYNTLGLVENAVMLQANNDFDQNTQTNNGNVNIQRTYQAEWTYNISVKGFRWDTANGGRSPTLATLSTSTNWDKYVTADKDLAGVLIVSR